MLFDCCTCLFDYFVSVYYLVLTFVFVSADRFCVALFYYIRVTVRFANVYWLFIGSVVLLLD